MEGLEGGRADGAATCSEGSEHLRVTAEGKETTRMIRKEQVFKKEKRRNVKEKGKESKQKINKQTDSVNGKRQMPLGLPVYLEARLNRARPMLILALCKNPNLPSTLCFF